MWAWRAALLAVVALIATQPARAETAAYDQAFASAFAETCLPGRLGYETTRSTAEASGWVPVATGDHPELAAVMARSEAEAADPEISATLVYQTYAREIAGIRHHLVVSRTSAVVSDPNDPWVTIGCYLYNFDAAAPLDPAPISAVLEGELSASREQDGVVSHVWGPTCPYPRSGDTYLNYVSEESAAAREIGFSGIALSFTTSEPDPGETVPETYC